jgi:hypothetical protein
VHTSGIADEHVERKQGTYGRLLDNGGSIMASDGIIEETDPKMQQAIKFFCDRLVALTVDLEDLDASGTRTGVRFMAFSGTVMEFAGVWCLLTAGHILRDLDVGTRMKKFNVLKCDIVDAFGTAPVSVQPIPFDLTTQPMFYIVDAAVGVDFGLIPLRSLFAKQMRANGIVALGRENWSEQHRVGMLDGFLLVGLPATYVEPQTREGDVAGTVRFAPTVVPLSRRAEPHEDSKPTMLTRFCGDFSRAIDLDIDGMSGGPIFGFASDPLRFWIVAIQESWLRPYKVVYGCPLPIIGIMVEFAISQFNRLGEYLAGSDAA